MCGDREGVVCVETGRVWCVWRPGGCGVCRDREGVVCVETGRVWCVWRPGGCGVCGPAWTTILSSDHIHLTTVYNSAYTI